MKKAHILASALLAASLIAGCANQGQNDPSGTATSGNGARDTVRFALDWTPNTNHTGIFVAREKGWYAEQGIDLQILPYSEANTPDVLVANGQADFGVSFAEGVVADRANGLPVKSVAAILQTNTSALVTLKNSGLDRPAKLEGKRYAGFGSPFEEALISTMIREDGGATGEFRNVTTNVFGFQSLVAGQTDFVWIYLGWDGVQARLDGVELNTFPLKEFGVPDYYTPVIIGSEKFLAEKGDVARRFLAATAQGYEFGASNPQEAADILFKSAPAGTFADDKLVRESQAYLAPHYKGSEARWGAQTLEKWTAFPQFYASTGKLTRSDGTPVKPEDLDYAAMFTNDFLPKP